MKKFLDIVRLVMYYTRKIFLTIWWIVSFLIFVILASGSVYYFLKPDLPPQEIWELAKEFFPEQIQYIKNNDKITEVLQYVEIDTNFVPSYTQEWSDALSPVEQESEGLVGEYDKTHLAPSLEEIWFLQTP